MTEAPRDLPHDSRAARGALHGLKVLDLSRVLAGPFAAQILADHGADVTKIEPPQGDETRELGLPFVGDSAAYFQGLNRNKRAISLDLSHPDGRQVLLRLLADADVLLENFLPGTMKKWGLDYMQDLIMDKLLRFGTLLVCLGFSGPALTQTYDNSPVPADSANCRAIAGQAEIDGTMQQIVGRACLQPDGTWQILQSPDGGVLMYPVAAYPYPDPWYWGPPLFIGVGASFIFVDRFHHFHHFDHFHQMDHNHFGARFGGGFHRGPFPGGGMHGFGGMHGSGGMHGFGGAHVFGGMHGSGGMGRH